MPYRDPEQRKLHDRQYYQQHKEHARAMARVNHQLNKERNNERRKRQYNENLARERTNNTLYRQKNRDELRQYASAYRDKNRAEINRKIAIYARTPKGRIRAHRSHLVRRARLHNVALKGQHTSSEWQELLAKYGNKCAACGSSERITKDHIVPIKLGGSDEIENIQPLCMPCNARKGARFVKKYEKDAA